MTYKLAFMVILETPIFTRQITALVSDDSYAELQQTIRLDPEAEALFPERAGYVKYAGRLKVVVSVVAFE